MSDAHRKLEAMLTGMQRLVNDQVSVFYRKWFTLEEARTQFPELAPHRCKYCGAPSHIEPSEQTPPPDYCHEGDHGEPEEKNFEGAVVQLDVPLRIINLKSRRSGHGHLD